MISTRSTRLRCESWRLRPQARCRDRQRPIWMMLSAITPRPTQRCIPSNPRYRQRFHPWRRFSTLKRPSHPVRQRCPARNGEALDAPPGIVPPVRQRNRFEIILCALEPAFVSCVEDELNQPPTTRLPYRTGFRDATLRQLMRLLEAEASQGGPSGRLYAHHLAHALVMRFLLHGKPQRRNADAATSPLPRHLLQRVLE